MVATPNHAPVSRDGGPKEGAEQSTYVDRAPEACRDQEGLRGPFTAPSAA
jgi:hypothetical protein